MNKIPPKLREELSNDPYYTKCAREDWECKGRITWEHALMYAGRQIQERFSIIPLCFYHHLGIGLAKKLNVDIAMRRATEEDKKKYPLLPWSRYK